MLTSFLRPDAPGVTTKSDDELRYCIDNREKYLPESVLGALSELQKRGVEFSDEEVRVIEEDMQARTQMAASPIRSYGLMVSDNYKDALVEDPDAYAFYSRRVLKIFTFFFGVFFGSILMAMNIGKTKNQLGTILVLLFGIGLTIIEVGIAVNANLPSSANILFGLLNATMIDLLFWNRFIGNSTLYRPRNYWAPLAIAIILAALVIAAMIYGNASLDIKAH